MKDQDKTKAQLIKELAEERRKMSEVGTLREELACSFASCEKALAKESAIVRAFHGIIYISSPTHEIEFLNDQGLGRTGYDPIGQKCYRVVHNLENVCPWCVADRVARGETVSQEVLSPKDNRWYDTVHTPYTCQGSQGGKMAMLYDITERKLAEAGRDRLIEELRTKNADLEMFSHAVSHDLKNPILTMRGLIKWIERDANSGNLERLNVNLKLVANAAVRMEQLVEDLLEFARVGRLKNPFEKVSLGELASEAVQLASGSIRERGVDVEITPGLPTVRGDRSRLLQVLQNLIENAVKFMGTQTNPRIEVGVNSEDGGTVFYVKDNGSGIEPEDQAKVFDLFIKLEEQGKGTGLGLALVKRILEVHGGRIWVESQGRGMGSTFYFTLGSPNSAREGL